MAPDNDRLRVLKSAPNGLHHITPNGASHGDANDDVSSMSGDDDMPLSQATRKSELTSPPRDQKRKRPVYAESSDEDTPLASSPRKSKSEEASLDISSSKSTKGAKIPTRTNGSVRKPRKKKIKEEPKDSESDQPVQANKKRTSRKRKVKDESDASENDEPLTKKRSKSRGKKVKEEASINQGTPKPKKRVKSATAEAIVDDGGPQEGDGKAKTDDGITKSKGKKKKEKEKEEEDQEEIFRWWDADPNGDGTIKWQTLEHNGVIFPPPYEPLPKGVKMKYNGIEVDLPSEAEEVAGFYGAMLETDHAQDATFNKNFFEDWKIVLKRHPPRCGTHITSFELCDFRPMFEHFEAEKAKKKAMTATEKKEAKKAKEEVEAKYMHCFLDGRKEKVGNFRVEPPGLFRGRGEHPKKGALKFRVRPEDITLNIGKDATIPIPNMPGKWKAIQHDNTVTWLANWTENINGNHKYVFLAAGSSLKGQSDMQKFEKARELKNHVDRIRSNYQQDLKSKVMADRQRATAMYFIDKLALRAGNEKGEDEADTVGCCSLRCEHVTLEAPDYIVFDFLGKDSIRYYNRVQVDAQVFKNIRIFKENKNEDDNLFDRVTTGSLNKHLNSEMRGLTAKVFRTFNASITFQRLLDEDMLKGATLQEKLNAYNKANRWVAILCNHQRSVPKSHDQSMEKMRHKLRGHKYERMKLRHALFAISASYKKEGKYADDESDLDDEWIAEYEDELKAKDIEKVTKKFYKENDKLEEDGKALQNDAVLQERIEAIEEEYEKLAKERGTKKAVLKRERPAEKLEEAIDKLADKIKTFKLQIDDRDAGKEVALGTSKINYLDPRITAAWCKVHDVPIEKIFSRTLVTKFPWALEIEKDWKF